MSQLRIAQHVGWNAVAVRQADVSGVRVEDDQHLAFFQHAAHLSYTAFKAVVKAVVGAVTGYKVLKQGVEGGRLQHLVGDQHTSDSRLTSGGQWYTRRLCQPIVVP